MMGRAAEPRGWVLYDAGCGVCAWWVPWWAPTLARLGLAVAPLQAPGVAARLAASPDALLADIRLLLHDGRQLAGADVYLYVMRRLWWAYPCYLLAAAPGLRWIFDRAYRAFADHRHRISGACAVRPVRKRRAFLTAEWRHVVMLNYEMDPRDLAPLVPAGTMLDLWQGRALVSVVGFRFLETRVLLASVPFHRHFDEVNLRFYVRRQLPDGSVRRGVVFVREFVSRVGVALLARLAYNEPYRVVSMRSTVPAGPIEAPQRLVYEWRIGGTWHGLGATAVGTPFVPEPGSEHAFVTEHYWGYTRQRDGSTLEYEVAHPSWRVWAAADPALTAGVVALYGERFRAAFAGPPTSALVAEGSSVIVYPPHRLTDRTATALAHARTDPLTSRG